MKRKILVLFLMILTVFIFNPIVGYAQAEEEYPIWVGEVQVTESNKNDVLGTSDEGATVVYNAEKNLLILNNANIKVGKKVDKDNHQTFRVAIYSTKALNINIKGNNSLGEYDETKYTVDNWYVTDGYSINYGIWLEDGNLTFVKSDGNGTLDIIDYSDGIKAKNITFNNDFGKLKINDKGELPQEDVPPCAISASGDVVINGGSFELESESQNGITANKVIINGGHIKIRTNYDKNTISSYDGIIIDDNIEVINAEYIKGTTNQLWVSNIDIDDGFVTIKGTKKNITFNSNGGSSVDSQEVSYGNKITKPTNPTKENYVFDGWYQDITLNVPFDFDTPIINDVTLYAKWTANEYKVTFDANEGTVTPSKNVTFGSVYGELPVPTRTGYTFDGWYTAKDSGTEIKSDTTVAITNEQILYAKWTANEYNIIITVNDEDMGSASANLTKANEGTKVSLTSLPKSGYHFVKWESEDVTITNNEFIMPPKNVTVKVIFEEDIPLTYKVAFDKNGGTGSMNDITGLTGTYTLPENKFAAPDGKQFKGWSLSNDGGIITKLDIDEDKIVYAIWENIPDDYSYEFKKGNNQKLIINNINSYTFTIDGDYSLFESLKIGNLNLIKDEDYTVTEGSTIITFTKKGLTKLNKLGIGIYNILVTYRNGKNVTGSLSLNKILPPKTDTLNSKTVDNMNYCIIAGITSIFGLIGSAFYIKKIY